MHMHDNLKKTLLSSNFEVSQVIWNDVIDVQLVVADKAYLNEALHIATVNIHTRSCALRKQVYTDTIKRPSLELPNTRKICES